jgi:Outer membrane protein beta-barrel family/TonB-dependent Receptor Plug Domain
VIVSAQRQVLDANLDRRVFDLSLDGMRGLPGVTVSQDGQVLLRGSDRVSILVDGKQTSLTGFGNQTGLVSIPAGSIATIEIVNNPSAAFDSAGMAGVINIVYKKDQSWGCTSTAESRPASASVELVFTHDLGERWRLSGSANWYENVIYAAETLLLFPMQPPFSVPRTQDDTWDMKINGLLRLPNGIEAQLSLVYYAAKNVAQGREAARSSIDLAFKKPVLNARAELVMSVSDLFNEFGLRHDIDGDGFDAVYENFYESQVVSVGINYEF